MDWRLVVAEKDRVAALAWKAGTRKLGRVTAEEDGMAFPRALLLLGANIVGCSGLPRAPGEGPYGRSS